MSIVSIGAALHAAGMGVLASLAVASLKGTLLIGVAWAASRAMPRGTAAIRHLLWASALAGLLLVPVFSLLVPRVSLPLSRIDVARAAMAAWAQSEREPQFVALTPAASAANALARPRTTGRDAAPAVPMSELSSAPIASSADTVSLLTIVWIVVVLALVLRAIAGKLRLSMWARRARPVHDAEWLACAQRLSRAVGITRPVTLLRSDRACVPMTWGIVYPTVLLPADADDWRPERRTIVLLHELAHIKRFDALTQLVAQLATAVCWFNPAVWYAARQMRREREHACDDFVLDAGARASDYAHDLLQIARSLMSSGGPAAAALAMARRSELEGRLLAILDPRISRRAASRGRLAASAFGIVSLAIPLAALSPARNASVREIAPRRLVAPELPAAASPRSTAPHTAGHELERSSRVPVDVRTKERPTVAGTSRTAAREGPDLETLIAVTRAAAKLTSDYDKAELLVTVAKHYIRDDELRTAYLGAVASLHSDYYRTQTLEPMLLKDSLPGSAVEQLVKIAALMTSDNDKTELIVKLARMQPAWTPAMRAALIGATSSMTSDYGRGRAITAIAARGELSSTDAINLINSAKAMSASYDKANALLAIAAHHPIDDRDVRRAYFAAAETISSASDYRRAVSRILE